MSIDKKEEIKKRMAARETQIKEFEKKLENEENMTEEEKEELKNEMFDSIKDMMPDLMQGLFNIPNPENLIDCNLKEYFDNTKEFLNQGKAKKVTESHTLIMEDNRYTTQKGVHKMIIDHFNYDDETIQKIFAEITLFEKGTLYLGTEEDCKKLKDILEKYLDSADNHVEDRLDKIVFQVVEN